MMISIKQEINYLIGRHFQISMNFLKNTSIKIKYLLENFYELFMVFE